MKEPKGKDGAAKPVLGFRLDGSYGEHPSHRLTAVVRQLCVHRRQSDEPPSYYAQALAAAGFEDVLTNLGSWITAEEPGDGTWNFLAVTSSLEQTIRSGGLGADAAYLPSGRVVHGGDLIRRPLDPDEKRALTEAAKRVVDLWDETPPEAERPH
jgi:hypothetical protein